MKANQEPKFPVYRVAAYGTDVEFTPNLHEADYAFKDSRGSVVLWSVSADGVSKIIAKKG